MFLWSQTCLSVWYFTNWQISAPEPIFFWRATHGYDLQPGGDFCCPGTHEHGEFDAAQLPKSNHFSDATGLESSLWFTCYEQVNSCERVLNTLTLPEHLYCRVSIILCSVSLITPIHKRNIVWMLSYPSSQTFRQPNSRCLIKFCPSFSSVMTTNSVQFLISQGIEDIRSILNNINILRSRIQFKYIWVQDLSCLPVQKCSAPMSITPPLRWKGQWKCLTVV